MTVYVILIAMVVSWNYETADRSSGQFFFSFFFFLMAGKFGLKTENGDMELMN